MSMLDVRLDIAIQYHSIRTEGDFSNPDWNEYCILPPWDDFSLFREGDELFIEPCIPW